MSRLRDKQTCGRKFRRQHPIGPYFADFACVSSKLVIEIDGGHHDQTADSDLERESFIRKKGWEILRFSDVNVEDDDEMVVRGIAQHLGLRYEFDKRHETGSGRHANKN